MPTGCNFTVNSYQIGARDIRIVLVEGFLDAHTFPDLEKLLSSLIDEGIIFIVLDFEKLEYISSAGLGVLIGIAKKVREKEGDLKLTKLSEKIFKIVNLLGFSKILQIFDTDKEALVAVQSDIAAKKGGV